MFGPGELFEIPKTRITRGSPLPPGQSLLHQFTPHVRSVWKEHFGRHPALLVSHEPPNYDFTVPNVGGRYMLSLFAIRLLEVGTIDIFEVDHLTSPIVADRDTITLMDGDDFRSKVRP
jgi:hypothetical protein